MTNALHEIFLEVARAIDGGTLVRETIHAAAPELAKARALHVLAVGKAARAMWRGLDAQTDIGARVASALIVSPPPADEGLPRPRVVSLTSDHPLPTARSLAAAAAVRDFVAARPAHADAADARLLVMLSGGGSALMAAPAAELSLDDKRAATAAVARAGASIHELNAVRKHLSAIKGGQLALASSVPVTVLALSDVIGDDPATIASGPFAADPTTFAQALALVDAYAPGAVAARAHLARGAAGAIAETPKPGDPRLAHVRHAVLAGPARAREEAIRAGERRGYSVSRLTADTEQDVAALAAFIGRTARAAATGPARPPGPPRLLVGNGEPRLAVTGAGTGGRATHLALLVARELEGHPRTAFLAAGTDDRDGNTDASGAAVDGRTWDRIRAAGIDPDAALAAFDSGTALAAVGALVRGLGTSNLLDVHLLGVDLPPHDRM